MAKNKRKSIRWLSVLSAASLFSGMMLTLSPTASFAATSYSTVQWSGLFSDQGSQYLSVQQPTSSQSETVTLRALHNNLTSANVFVYDLATGSTTTIPMQRAGTGTNGVYDFWQATIPATGDPYYYYFQANDGTSTAYYNGYGASATAPATSPTSGDFWVVPGFTTPSWAQSGVMYQIFVDRFYNGNTANDVTNGEYSWYGNPTVKLAWGQDPELGNMGGSDQVAFAGGDLEGVDQKLPYITQSLGANILYLNPIFTANTNHKYDTQNYYQVDPHFGGNAALQTLITDVHNSTDPAGQSGKIVLDGVFNHTGATNSWFTSAQSSQSSSTSSYYTFTNWPNQYATFAGVSNLPKLNYGSSALQSQIENVAQTYLKSPYGIDGWRLDAPGHVGANGYDPEMNGNYTDPTNHQWWSAFRTAVKSVNPNAFIFGEWFEGSQPYEWLNGMQWDSSVNYNGFLQPASEWITGYDDGFNKNSVTTTSLDTWLHDTLVQAPRPAQLTQVNELSTQDVPRFGERAASTINYKTYTTPTGSTFTEPYGGTPNYWKDYLGAFLQFTYVGLPTIYYGDEYGMLGGGTNDAGKRWTFDWSQVANGGNSVFQLYSKLVRLREQNSALQTGSFMTLAADNNTNVYSFARFNANQRFIVVLNNSSATQTETIPAYEAGAAYGSTFTNVTPLVNGVTEPTSYTVDSNGNLSVTVNGHYAVILEQQGTPLFGSTNPVVTSPTISTTSLSAATVNSNYSATLAATGGTSPYTWSLSNGTLPAGLSLSTAGVISGTPTTSGSSSFTVKVTDANGKTATQSLSLTVNQPVPSSPVTANPSPLVAGQPATITYDGTLASSATSITMHWGYNGWSGVTNTPMTKQANGTWTASITIPAGATAFNSAYYNQSSTWDSNGGSNYNLAVG